MGKAAGKKEKYLKLEIGLLFHRRCVLWTVCIQPHTVLSQPCLSNSAHLDPSEVDADIIFTFFTTTYYHLLRLPTLDCDSSDGNIVYQLPFCKGFHSE